MKTLELKKIESNRKASKYTYQVIEDGKVLAERKSNREYAACYVEKYTEGSDYYTKKTFTPENPHFTTPYFFGRMDLIGKGDSSKRSPNSFYAIAILKQNH